MVMPINGLDNCIYVDTDSGGSGIHIISGCIGFGCWRSIVVTDLYYVLGAISLWY